MFLVKRPHLPTDEQVARSKARAAAAALASISGASLDPLAGPGHVSALHSGRWKTH